MEPSLVNNTTHIKRPVAILLVEDDETVREVTAELLQEIGYRIYAAATPQKALELCADKQTIIDLLLTDIIMPKMNGAELSLQICVMRPSIRVLFMSGYAADVIDQKNISTGGFSFIQKPFDLDSLNRKIQFILQDDVKAEKNSPAIYS